MKNISIIAAIIAVFTISCAQSSEQDQKASQHTDHAPKNVASSSKQNTSGAASASGQKQAKSPAIEAIINDYLSLKNALVKDNDRAAAQAGKKMLNTLTTVKMGDMQAKERQAFMEIADEIKENAEHISTNVGKIDHQREHLAALSKDIADLMSLFGTEKQLYEDFCPMFNGNKGAIWISEYKEIKNPYYGSQMLTCGSVKSSY